MSILTFFEVDVDTCDNVYGALPCQARAWQSTNGEGIDHIFANNNNSWAVSQATLTATPGGMDMDVTGTNAYIRRSSLTIAGGTYRYAYINFTCLEECANWQGVLYYETSGHGSPGSYYKSLGISSPEVGKRYALLLDMYALDAGGNDWQTNTITALRFDLSDDATGHYLIHEISVGSLLEPEFTRYCNNSLGTCQDRGNFTPGVITTFRFAMDSEYLDLKQYPCIPNMAGYSHNPGKISLGRDMGIRQTLAVTLNDHRHSDAGPDYDRYPETRTGNPYNKGTYWGKFRARHPYLTGRTCRLIRVEAGQPIEEGEVLNFIIDSTNGPDTNNTYTVTAKDVLSFANGDRAQAPFLSEGRLNANITNSQTSAVLQPSGIGATYAASGLMCIGGREVVSFTRSGDNLTITRGQQGTTAVAHSANDRCQTCLQYSAASAADVLYDLLTNYAGIPADYIDFAAWEFEVDTFLQQQFTTLITEPTSVADLCNELIESGGLALWWDAAIQQIRLQVLREIAPTATVFDELNINEGSFSVGEQPTLRISQVWVYFARRDPTKSLTDEDNYRNTDLSIDLETEANYGVSAIKKIFSRWIPLGGLSVAQAVSLLILSQYKVPPRLAQLTLPRLPAYDMVPGIGYRLGSWVLQDADGVPALINSQVVSREVTPDQIKVQAEEMNFARADILSTRFVYISTYEANVNLRTLHDAFFPPPQPGDVGNVTIHAIIDTAGEIYSNSISVPAFDVGDWPLGMEVIVEVRGAIRGRCGNGGAGGRGGNASGSSAGNGVAGSPGQAGGTALYTRHAITLRYSLGDIWGGAGGGGGGGGGGSAYSITSGGQNVRGGGSGGGGGGCRGTEGGAAPGARGAAGTGASGIDGNPGVVGGNPNGGAGGAAKSSTWVYQGRGGTAGNAGNWGQAGTAGTNNAEGGGANTAVGNPAGPGAGGAAGNAIDGWSYVTIEGAAGDLRGPTVN